MSTTFARAVKHRARARIAIIGPAGSGKTFTALAVGAQIASRAGGRLAVIDTERGSASLYADRWDYDVLEMADNSPRAYIEAVEGAVKAGYAALAIDSLSHAWMGRGGELEMVEEASARSKSGNSYVAWRNVTPWHNRLVDTILMAQCHVICTLRAKTEYVQERDASGRTVVRKIGLAPVMRDGIEYEFTICGDIDLDHRLVITKSRCAEMADAVIQMPGAALADQLYDWLMAGHDVQPVAAAVTVAPPAQVEDPTQQTSQAPAAAGNTYRDVSLVRGPVAAPAPASDGAAQNHSAGRPERFRGFLEAIAGELSAGDGHEVDREWLRGKLWQIWLDTTDGVTTTEGQRVTMDMMTAPEFDMFFEQFEAAARQAVGLAEAAHV